MAKPDVTCPVTRPIEGFYTSEVETSERWPIRTFLPTGYEPNYPYPLVVFFHGHAGNEEQILRLAPALSRRNYICIGLRGPETIGFRPDGRLGYFWGNAEGVEPAVEEYVMRAIEQTRSSYHIHSERIYLAGFCEGSLLAYRLGLMYPEKFAGVMALNGQLPRGTPLMRFSQVRGLRVFIGHGIANVGIPLSVAQRDFRLLYTAGLDVHLHTYPTTHRVHSAMLTDLNRWMMSHIDEALL